MLNRLISLTLTAIATLAFSLAPNDALAARGRSYVRPMRRMVQPRQTQKFSQPKPAPKALALRKKPPRQVRPNSTPSKGSKSNPAKVDKNNPPWQVQN